MKPHSSICRWRWCVLGLALILLPLTATAQRNQRVTVTALDYAYQLPDTLRAGRTTLGMVNRGAVRHELILLKLRPGATLADFLSRPRAERLAFVQDSLPVGMLFAAERRTAPGELVVRLERGATYILVCNFRDTPQSQTHAELGMVKTVHVR